MKDAITAVSASAFIFSLACGLSFADADTPSSPSPSPSLQLEKLGNANLAELVATYKGIHAHPELSHHEEQPTGLFATELRKAGYAVTEHVGKYPDGSQADGVVAVLENGPSPRVMLRIDLDALPIIEEAGVSYASKIKSKNPAGQEVGVMHACGHDIHVTTLIGAARALASNRQNWPGTLLLIGQPSEETGDGAKAILTDRLYERFRQSDLAVMLHETNMLAAGTVSVTSGYAMAGVNSVDVTLRGTGGHGAQP